MYIYTQLRRVSGRTTKALTCLSYQPRMVVEQAAPGASDSTALAPLHHPTSFDNIRFAPIDECILHSGRAAEFIYLLTQHGFRSKSLDQGWLNTLLLANPPFAQHEAAWSSPLANMGKRGTTVLPHASALMHTCASAITTACRGQATPSQSSATRRGTEPRRRCPR